MPKTQLSEGTRARVQPMAYLVTIMPQELVDSGVLDSADAAEFSIQVERRRGDRWVLRQGEGARHDRGVFLTAAGTWQWDFRADPQEFSEEEALAKAREWAPKIRVMRTTAAEALRQLKGTQ